MGIAKALIPIFLIMLLLVLAQPAQATNSDQLHKKLAAGFRARSSDVDAINNEIAAAQFDPYKRMVAGEVLSSLGLFSLAADQYAQAEKLQNEYVLKEFKNVFETNQYIPALQFMYLQDKYPQDPAVLLYKARRNLSELAVSKEEQHKAIGNAWKELQEASQLPEPWRGTFALIAMMEYNQGKFQAALKNADKELEKNPDQALAQKVKILALDRLGHRQKGYKLSQLQKLITDALKNSARDDELNLLLGRAYISAGDHKSALKPALLGLLDQHDANTLHDGRNQVFEIMKHVSRKEFLGAVNEVCSEYSEAGSYGAGFRTTLLRMRIADLFSIAGDREEACNQLMIALRMHPQFRATVAFKLGRELTFMHRYSEALQYLDLACRSNRNPANRQKYLAMRMRVADILINSERDIALKLKSMFSER